MTRRTALSVKRNSTCAGVDEANQRKNKLKELTNYIIRSQEKNLNQDRDSNLGPPDL